VHPVSIESLLSGGLIIVGVRTFSLLFFDLLAYASWFDVQLRYESARHVDLMDVRAWLAAGPAIDAAIRCKRATPVCVLFELL
jgi:hypothetical protein